MSTTIEIKDSNGKLLEKSLPWPIHTEAEHAAYGCTEGMQRSLGTQQLSF
jgi:hypothetical protein